MKIALIQMKVGMDKEKNLHKARELVLHAGREGARIAVLPEMFCCPYANEYFPKFAEPVGGLINTELSRMAKDANVTLVGGSFPLEEDGKLYNASFVFARDGSLRASHRKAHLFDIDVEGGQYFRESDVFTPGDQITVFRTAGHTFGLAVCFDIRFPEMFRCMALRGAEAVFVPAAFNMTTGPMHWELSFRMRAVDNQLFTIGVSPAQDKYGVYHPYAHSLVCDPWGKVLADAGENEGVALVDIDLDEVGRVRQQLPILSARKPELYGMKE
ncbi:MAG: carbon-nitrogen hydrolase family protein [Firmicutes bacterium]|nr:carbon-nitrogen hydrolase family protein [Bacillota bacterium]